MGRYKRTYSYEQLTEAVVDAALSVFPREHRQRLRPDLLKTYLTNSSVSHALRNRRYRQVEFARAITAGMNQIGPDLLETFNASGGKASVEELMTAPITARLFEDDEARELATRRAIARRAQMSGRDHPA